MIVGHRVYTTTYLTIELSLTDLASHYSVIVNTYHMLNSGLGFLYRRVFETTSALKKIKPLVLKLCYFYLWCSISPESLLGSWIGRRMCSYS